jgi:uncharacterized Zn finger protein
MGKPRLSKEERFEKGLAMISEHATSCPTCMGSFDYRLVVADGGGFRYEVACTSCGEVYYDISSLPSMDSLLAA